MDATSLQKASNGIHFVFHGIFEDLETERYTIYRFVVQSN